MTADTPLLLRCAHLCEASYDQGAAGFVDVDDLRYGVFFESDIAIVAIRGTANAHNALRDVWIRPSRICTGEWVHKGFASGFEVICQAIKSPGNPTVREVIWTGHSFGAAVALLLADVAGVGQCVTFGCPRPYLRFNGNPNPRHTRVRTDDDPVTMIPRAFYRLPDPGREIVLRDDDNAVIDVADHSMSVYKERLERWLLECK